MRMGECSTRGPIGQGATRLSRMILGVVKPKLGSLGIRKGAQVKLSGGEKGGRATKNLGLGSCVSSFNLWNSYDTVGADSRNLKAFLRSQIGS